MLAWRVVNAPLEIVGFFVNDLTSLYNSIVDYTHDKGYGSWSDERAGTYNVTITNRTGPIAPKIDIAPRTVEELRRAIEEM